ncbi:hypothetical protein CRG98_042840 [Punica granatum]|uniref:Uncharacterized protein n=1 Tax=Punica granatum TaxID=22663 RepID=A0A2I0HYT2_PUNGR|nr:hypothetical protein CRG98_042840 [Punica granatum]
MSEGGGRRWPSIMATTAIIEVTSNLAWAVVAGIGTTTVYSKALIREEVGIGASILTLITTYKVADVLYSRRRPHGRGSGRDCGHYLLDFPFLSLIRRERGEGNRSSGYQ